MTLHAVLGLSCLLLSSVTALTALVYAVSLRTRRWLRWPLVVVGVLSCVLVVLAKIAGHVRLAVVEASASAAEVAAAQTHAKGTDLLAMALGSQVVVIVIAVWRPLDPAKDKWTSSMRIWAGVLGLLSAGTLAAAARVLMQALNAANGGNPV